METFLDITSFLSIPSFLGNPPTITATLTPVHASATSVVAMTPVMGNQRVISTIPREEMKMKKSKRRAGTRKPLRRGKAASTNSIFTPLRASAAGGISSMCKITGWSAPSMTPLAIIGTSAYPICPAKVLNRARYLEIDDGKTQCLFR